MCPRGGRAGRQRSGADHPIRKESSWRKPAESHDTRPDLTAANLAALVAVDAELGRLQRDDLPRLRWRQRRARAHQQGVRDARAEAWQNLLASRAKILGYEVTEVTREDIDRAVGTVLARLRGTVNGPA